MRFFLRRLLRFRLRGLLILVTMLSIGLGWYSAHTRALQREMSALRVLLDLTGKFGGTHNALPEVVESLGRPATLSAPFVTSSRIVAIKVAERTPGWSQRLLANVALYRRYCIDEVYLGPTYRPDESDEPVFTFNIAGDFRSGVNGGPIEFKPPKPLSEMSDEEIKRRYGTGVDDRAIEPLMAFKSAYRITLDQTNITAEGVQRLREALPNTDIVVIEPKQPEPDATRKEGD